MNRVYLLTGGNMGNRAANLQTACQLIQAQVGVVFQQSSVYETEAWGYTQQASFYNQVLAVHTPLPPTNLLQQLMAIEKEMGRFREQPNGPRIIDIDILFFNEDIIETQMLQIPHPRLHLRKFTLVPLAEIAPHLAHPLLKKDISTLLTQCEDPLNVKKILSQNE